MRYGDGRIKLLTGYRVQHNTLRGPGKGASALEALRREADPEGHIIGRA